MGGLLALTGVLGIAVLVLDKVLTVAAPMHYYALILFVVIDFAIAAFVLMKTSRMAFTAAAAWSILRIILQLADVSQAHVYQMRYTVFADYLFNPVSSAAAGAGNPMGVPGALIDLIMIFELVFLWTAWKARSSK